MRYAFMALALVGCAAVPLEPPTGQTVEYAVTQQSWGANYVEALALGLDINGDKSVDNQLGQVFSTMLARQIDITGATGTLIERGQLRLTTSVQYARDSDPSDSIAFSTTVAGAPSPTPLLGEHTKAPMLAGPGELAIAFAFCGEPVTLALAGAHVRIDRADDSTMTGRIAGAVRPSDVNAILVPNFARRLNEQVALECTDFAAADCGCIHTDVEYEANYWLELFDVAPHKDCVITAEEILASSLTMSLLSPDVTVDGDPMQSLGFAFEARR